MLTSIILTGALLGAAAPVHTPQLIVKAIEMGYVPCAQEDSVGPCYWDATVRGNGKGKSFVVTDDNEVFYSH